MSLYLHTLLLIHHCLVICHLLPEFPQAGWRHCRVSLNSWYCLGISQRNVRWGIRFLKKTGQIGEELWWTINGSLINYRFKEILWNIAEQMSPSASRFPLDLKNATRPYPLCHCYVVRGQSWTRINCMGFILIYIILRVPINLNWRLTTEHSL